MLIPARSATIAQMGNPIVKRIVGTEVGVSTDVLTEYDAGFDTDGDNYVEKHEVLEAEIDASTLVGQTVDRFRKERWKRIVGRGKSAELANALEAIRGGALGDRAAAPDQRGWLGERFRSVRGPSR